MHGPLQGLKIIEIVGLGPGPFAAMMLADMGAEVIRIERPPKPSANNPFPMLGTAADVMARGRRSLALDLKQPEDRQLLLQLIAAADGLIEGFRPGVMEKLGLGPEPCLAVRPALVYGRITGWGQDGPLAQAAGHDLNYLAITGMLHAIGRSDSAPPPPLNLLADFGGGGMLLAFGMVCAMLEASRSGKGQVIDAAMVDGAALLGAMIYGFKAYGAWSQQRSSNLLDGGAHFYDSYRCADGRYIAIAPIEPQFYAELLKRLQIDDPAFAAQMDASRWPELKQKLQAIFATHDRRHWCDLLEGSEVCFAPVLDMDEAPQHPHMASRNSFIDIAGVRQPAPAPRFSRTPASVSRPPASPGQHSEQILADWGIAPEQIETYRLRHGH